MGGSNSNIVRRTWGLLQTLSPTSEDKKFAYGDAFNYDEFMQMPNKISALILSLTIFVGAGLAMVFSPVSSSLLHVGTLVKLLTTYFVLFTLWVWSYSHPISSAGS